MTKPRYFADGLKVIHWLLILAAAFFIGLVTAVAPFSFLIIFVIILGALLVWVICGPGPWWTRSIAMMLIGSLLLGQGFSNVAFGMGSAKIPLTELLVLVSLIYLVMKLPVKDLIGGAATAMLLTCSLTQLLIRLPIDFMSYGIVALRDATHYVDMWAFVVGTGAALMLLKYENLRATWLRFFVVLSISSGIYIITYPMRGAVAAISPVVMGYQQRLPIFGYYNMVNMAALSVIMLAILMSKQIVWPGLDQYRRLIFVTAIFCVIGLLLMQTRAVYVALIVMLIGLSTIGWLKHTLVFFVILIFIFIGFEFATALGFSVSGKLAIISFGSLYDMLTSIGGHGELHGAAYGTHQRLEWWSKLLNESVATPVQLIFGRGFGEALTNFYAPGASGQVIVREPHNSFISVYARGGLFVFLTWMIFKLIVYWQLAVAYLRAKTTDVYAGFYLWVVLFLVANDIRAVVEPVYEFPYGAVPLYFFSGFALALARRAIQKNSTPTTPIQC